MPPRKKPSGKKKASGKKKRVPKKTRVARRQDIKADGVKWFEKKYRQLPDFLLHFTRLENARGLIEDYKQGRVLKAHFNLVGERLRRAPFPIYWEKMEEYVRPALSFGEKTNNPRVLVCIIPRRTLKPDNIKVFVRSPGTPNSDIVVRDIIPLTAFKGKPKTMEAARRELIPSSRPAIIQLPAPKLKSLQAKWAERFKAASIYEKEYSKISFEGEQRRAMMNALANYLKERAKK